MPTTQLSLPPPQGTVRQPCSPPPCYSDSVRPCLAGVLEAALSCQSPSLDSEDLCALSELQFSHLCMGLKLPGLPTSQGCPEDPLRLHVRGTDLPQSTVQIKGLLELLLPPELPGGQGEGLVPSSGESPWRGKRSAPLCPPVVLEPPAGRLPGPWGGEAKFTPRAALSPGPRQRGSQGGQRKCKQLPPSHPGLWSLRRKTLLPKIAHPKLWPASFKLPTISLGMNEGGRQPVRSWPSAPSPA